MRFKLSYNIYNSEYKKSAIKVTVDITTFFFSFSLISFLNGYNIYIYVIMISLTREEFENSAKSFIKQSEKMKEQWILINTPMVTI